MREFLKKILVIVTIISVIAATSITIFATGEDDDPEIKPNVVIVTPEEE